MDTSELQSLITNGENESVDFKREINLTSARSKAEFVKDVISIANSSPTWGHLIIGVDTNNFIIGIDRLEEEQLQQIAHTYISPPVVMNCYYVLVKELEVEKKVGIIEIKALRKPHKVVRTIEHIQQDDVYIRRGSVVMKASPEEVIIMNQESSGTTATIQEIIRRAQAHIQVKNFDMAISLYSDAINIFPSCDLLISRAKLFEEVGNNNLAFIDFSNALKLDPPISLEKISRLGMLRQYNLTSLYSWEDFEKDYQWLRENTEGRAQGEVIYEYIDKWENHDLYSLDVAEEMLFAVDEAINLGFLEPEIFHLRSIANKSASNYGAALHDIDKAISIVIKLDKKVEYLCHKAEVLVSMKNFEEANSVLSEAVKIDSSAVKMYLTLGTYKGVEEILCLYGLENKYSGDVPDEPMNQVLRFLIVWHSRRVTGWRTDRQGVLTKIKTKLTPIMEAHPKIINSLLSILNVEETKAVNNGDVDYTFKFRFPTHKEQINRRDSKNTIVIHVPHDIDDD